MRYVGTDVDVSIAIYLTNSETEYGMFARCRCGRVPRRCTRRLHRNAAARCATLRTQTVSKLRLPPLHFPNPGRESGGIIPGEFLEFHMRFGAFSGNLVAAICRPSDPIYL